MSKSNSNGPYDLTNVVSISVYKSRKPNEYPPLTEKQAAMLRGFVAWKKSNWAKMKERDEAEKAAQKAKRQKS